MPSLIYRFENRDHNFPLKDRTTVGRIVDNDLCVACDSISSHHAVITRNGDGFQIEDMGSRNGVVVKGRRVPVFALEDGTTFELGDVEFLFRAADENPAAVPMPPAQVEHPHPPAAGGHDAAPTAASAQTETAHEPGGAGLSTAAERAGATTPKRSEGGPAGPAARLRVPTGHAAAAGELVAGDSAAAAGPGPEAVIERFKETRKRVLDEIGKVIVGQREVINQMLVALFARGHCLLIGVPGLAKTLMVKTLGGAVDLESRRIQFTPDLMPSDITGTDILEEDSATGKRAFRFHRGPIFSNLLLADEINRTPPKTQAALLEAMQEHRVTISGTSYDLPEPFMVLATQNPIEQEGTYPLPEAQLDRFMFCVHLGYPGAEDERQVILDTTRELAAPVNSVLTATDVTGLQQLVRQVPVSEHVAMYALNLVRATRPGVAGAPDFVNRWIRWGAGTRAGQYLLLAAKAHVLLQGRFSVSCADVREYALPVLRHRIFPNFTAASEGVNTDQIVKKILGAVKEPSYEK